MAQLAVAKLVGESRRSAHRRQCCRNKHHSQDHHYPSSYAHSTSFLSVTDGLCWRNGGLLEGSVGFCAEPSRCVCEPFVCRCSPISSPLESGSTRDIGHQPKGLNSLPPKGLMPKGLPLRQRTGSTGLVSLGCCKCPRRLILGKWASGIRASRKSSFVLCSDLRTAQTIGYTGLHTSGVCSASFLEEFFSETESPVYGLLGDSRVRAYSSKLTLLNTTGRFVNEDGETFT